MADNIDVTPGVGKTVSSDERTIAATTVHVQRVDEQAGTGFTAGHVDISTTAATIVAAKETRKRVTIFNSMVNTPVYVGPTTVTLSTGIRLDPGVSMDFFTTALIQGITAIAHSASGEDDKVHYCDFHD